MEKKNSMKAEIEKHLDELAERSKPKNVFVIEYKGERLTLTSRKSSWVTLAAAKNAIRYEVRNFRWGNSDWGSTLPVIENLEAEGIIKYIKL